MQNEKILMSGAIFIAALLGGWPLLWIKKNRFWQSFFFLSEHFAQGIFLSTGLIHLLPDAASTYQHTHLKDSYPVTFLICALTIFAIQLIEHTAKFLSGPYKPIKPVWLPYLLIILLSIHSIIAGSALGLDGNARHVLILFLAIIAHKTAETFALGMTLSHQGVPRPIQMWLILIFAAITPVSIMTATYLMHTFTSSLQNMPLQSVFSAMTAGTFLYIAFLPASRPATLWSTLAFGSGIAFMAAVGLHG